jgi:hypothetical protein
MIYLLIIYVMLLFESGDRSPQWGREKSTLGQQLHISALSAISGRLGSSSGPPHRAYRESRPRLCTRTFELGSRWIIVLGSADIKASEKRPEGKLITTKHPSQVVANYLNNMMPGTKAAGVMSFSSPMSWAT